MVITVNKELLKLLKENPSLPVYAYVDAEICGDDWGYWMGGFGRAEIKKFAKVKPWGYNESDIVYDDELGDYENYLLENEYTDLSYEDAEEMVKNELNALQFKKAIFVYIEIPKY